jgi:hypothetical protein
MLVRQTTATNFIDLLDHVVDKGIVIDAWVALWSAGINLVKSDARLVVVRAFRLAGPGPPAPPGIPTAPLKLV